MLNKNSKSIGLSYGEIAERNAPFPALIRENMTLTHGEFWQLVRAVAFKMRDQGVNHTSLVCLNTHDAFVSLAVLLATSLLGSRFIVASKLLAKTQIVQPTHFFRSFESKGTNLVEFVEIDRSWYPTEATLRSTDTFPGTPDLDADWLYLHTSGTTGQPKYIALSERMVRDRTLAVCADFPFRKTTFASTFKCTSRPFFARALGTLFAAGAIVDGTKIDFWKKCGVNLACGAPGQLSEILKGKTITPRLPLLEASGARLTPKVAKEYLRSFAQVVDVYGAGETNKTYATINTLGPNGELVTQGKKLDSELQIVRPDGEPCQAGEIGSVRVKNHYSVTGYLFAPEQSAKSFRDGWFYPGDLAMWGDKGELIVVSREDDVINIGGYKVNAPMLDMLFSSVEGVDEAIVFHNPKPNVEDRVLAFVVFEAGADRMKTVGLLCNLFQTKIGIPLSPRCIRTVDAIPRTESGDPDRKRCEDLVRERAGLLEESE